MAKLIATLFMIAILLSFTLASTARPQPEFSQTNLVNNQHEGVEAKHDEVVDENENCEGLGTKECLMRRTLAAQTDYIYTQNHKP